MLKKLTVFFGLATLLIPVAALAQTTVSVTGAVETTASAARSSLLSDVQTLPADGSTQVTLTATIVDEGDNPLIGSTVVITSDRGDVDTIFCYDGDSLIGNNSTLTNSNGVARCVATSKAPGQATFSARVDSQVTLDDHPLVTFTALPVLQNLTVTVTLPGGKKITILKPPAGTPPVTSAPEAGAPLSHQSGTGQLVNTGINVEISFWSLVLSLILILLIPLFFLVILILIRRIRLLLMAEKRNREKEESLLAKIYQLEQQTVQTTTEIKEEIESPETNSLPPTNPPSNV